MSVDLFVPTPGTVSPVLLHFYTRSELWCSGSFVFSVLNRWKGESLIRSYWRLQTWVTKYWTMWTSDKIPLMRRGYQVPPPTKKLFAVVTHGERGEKNPAFFSWVTQHVSHSLGQAAWPGVVEEYKHTPCFYFWDYDSIIFPFPSFLPSLPIDSFLLAFKFMELYAFLCMCEFLFWYFYFIFFIVCLPAFVLCGLFCLFRDHEAGWEDKQACEDLRGTGGGEEYNSNTLYEK